MAMSIGPSSGRKAEINVTPMIDILLVLLIIFMVIPHHSLGLDAKVPQESKNQSSTPPPPSNDLVITVEANKRVKLNQESMPLADLGKRLRGLFAGPSNKVIFLRADKDLYFEDIAEVIDAANGAGMQRIALMTR